MRKGSRTPEGVVDPQAGDPEWSGWIDRRAAAIRSSGRWRTVREFDALGPTGTLPAPAPCVDVSHEAATGDRHGRVVSFASNDYLGLSHHPAVVEGARRALERWGAGSGSSRLIVGSRPVHSTLEEALADWKKTERCVVFSSGYAANLGVLGALGDADVGIYSDELNHASIVDGCRLSRAEVTVYPHRDVGQLDALIAKARRDRIIIVTDAVFSMDGDVADMVHLLDVATRHGALLVVDEAHSVLPLDSEARETLEAAACEGVVVRVGTMSKTLGSLGGFVACTGSIADMIVNTARSFIFTTALSPPDAGAALAALEVLRSAEGDALVSRLVDLLHLLAPSHPSPIVPVIVGDEDEAVRASCRLLESGYLVPAIRPPSVAAGTSRLRISVSSDHTDDQVRGLRSALETEGLSW